MAEIYLFLSGNSTLAPVGPITQLGICKCVRQIPGIYSISGKPHSFEISTLRQWTDNFNDAPLAKGGRFIGEGGFGKVYLGTFNTSILIVLTFCTLQVMATSEKTTNRFAGPKQDVVPAFRHQCFV